MTTGSVSDTTPEAAFATALSEFQAELPPVSKGQTATVKSDKGSYTYQYADLTFVTEAALPILTKYGFAWTAAPTLTDTGFVLRYALIHVGGHREGGEYPLPDPSKASSQQIGSALTYARRYSFCAVTGIAPGGDDDDGEKASDARASDITVRDPGRTRGQTTRSKPAGPQDDPWTEPERVTDLAWIEGFRRRVVAAATPSELRGLQEEANVQWAEHKLSREDAAALKAEVTAREAELKGDAA